MILFRDMEFKIEKIWTSKEGYICVVAINPIGFRCGYVGVPDNHPIRSKDYDLDFEVHGGLTYSGYLDQYKNNLFNGLWFLGFDCGHAEDSLDFFFDVW